MYQPSKLPIEAQQSDTVFTLDALIAWLRTKNPEETYCYGDNGGCLLAQYFSEQLGIADVRVGGSYWRDASLPRGMKTRFRHGLAVLQSSILGPSAPLYPARLRSGGCEP